MEIAITMGAAKEAVELVHALMKLLDDARSSRDANLQEVLLKLRGEAIRIARGLDARLADLVQECRDKGIDLNLSQTEIEQGISRWNLPRRLVLKSVAHRLTALSRTVANLYADVEAAFICAEKRDTLGAAVSETYKLREELYHNMRDDAPFERTIDALRKSVQMVLYRLEA